jgi:Sad1 / UNC-like C-terminal
MCLWSLSFESPAGGQIHSLQLPYITIYSFAARWLPKNTQLYMLCDCVISKHQQILLFLLVWTTNICCGTAAETSVPCVSATPLSPAVCPYRTVNYITHSLAQQCLPTTRSARSSTTKTDSSSSSPTTSQVSIAFTTTTDHALPYTTSFPTVDEGHSDVRSPVTIQPTAPATISEEETDSESPLGKDNFLSFEEWRKRNLDKYGQSPDEIGKSKKLENLQSRTPPINVLDSFGDEAEIDLDFSGFASEKPQVAVPSYKDAPSAEAGGQNRGRDIPKTKSRSKDAGTTFKERFNFASFDCAATILKTNAKSSSSSAVLVENKDSYMLNECSVENKFLILELCEDILIDTIVLANFEFFSSIFRSFRVSVTGRYPAKLEKWKMLGTFEARNTREVQAFLVENPLIWTKYVRIEFLTHYGNEFYCPLSLVRVHGTTMLEDYRHDEDPSKIDDRDDDDDQLIGTSETTETNTVIPEAVAENLVQEKSSKIAARQEDNVTATKVALENAAQPSNETASYAHNGSDASMTLPAEQMPHPYRNVSVGLFDLLQQQCLADEKVANQAPVNLTAGLSESSESSKTHFINQSLATEGDRGGRLLQQSSATASPTATRQSKGVEEGTAEKSSTTRQFAQTTDSPSSTRITSARGSESSRPTASSTQPLPANPPIQESFFKSVQKRLQMLESNSTLSLQYIEEQSRILRDAFNKVEQRQLSKTSKFLDYLNGTVLNELRDFRQQYDQLWQSTVIELDAQREQSQREVIAINTRLSILADELVFQKRMAILQSILVLICIGLVLFSRGSVNSYLEHPLVQNMLTRSATLKMRSSFFDTPNLSPESTRPNSAYKVPGKTAYSILKGHQRNLSEDSQDGADNPAIAYSPPTPASYDGQSDVDDGDDEQARRESPPGSSTDTPRSRSSPPVVHHSVDDPDTPTQSRQQSGHD